MRLRDEEGSALLLALGFLALFGVLIAAVLSFANTNLFATLHLRDQRATIYAGGGAVDGAIMYVRGNNNCGWPGADCTFMVTIGTLPVTVNCQWAGETGRTIDTDRTVLFTASVGGVPQVQAKVLFGDTAAAGTGQPPAVAVLSWTVLP